MKIAVLQFQGLLFAPAACVKGTSHLLSPFFWNGRSLSFVWRENATGENT